MLKICDIDLMNDKIRAREILDSEWTEEVLAYELDAYIAELTSQLSKAKKIRAKVNRERRKVIPLKGGSSGKAVRRGKKNSKPSV
jgi:predicted nucleotidyltransferase